MKGNYKLKWHKFTIYFALFTLTAITLFAAVPFFIGKPTLSSTAHKLYLTMLKYMPSIL